MVTQQKANRLINSTSPYLLQHAYNPVDWYEWGTEALEKAKLEDKPILVSIGYSSCHWCHVMERECFENEDIAEIMNAYFVCIKVDREERPDIDHLYMDAVQALGIQGGWPLNVFITPDQKPFFGGTYFPSQKWVQVLKNIHKAFESNRDQVEGTAEELRMHLLESEVERFKHTPTDADVKQYIEEAYKKLEPTFDKEWGGLDKTPKFVMPSIWLWILRYFYFTKNQQALDHVVFTLKRIGRGGIYDQIGGGFARYSVDRYWHVPHFEKMLYDNAQLMSLYAEAYSVTKDEEFKTIVYETFDWLQREMTSDDGGFYSALDADSDGVEGKFYVWTSTEIKRFLDDEAELFSRYYSVDEKGNWEHGNNILKRNVSDDVFLQENNLDADHWKETLKTSKKILLRERNKRIPPSLDDKIITAWNALMITGLCDAYCAFGDTRFIKAALLNMRFLENELMEGTTIYRSYKTKRSTTKGFLDDYAFVIQAQIKLYEVTLDEYWIKRAEMFMNFVIENFYDAKDGFFYYTSQQGEQLLNRKKEIFDNVIPSSNAIIAHDLNKLAIILDREDWKNIAQQMTFSISNLISTEPGYMSQWGITYLEIKKGLHEVVFVGDNAPALLLELNKHFYPFAFTMGTKTKSELPLIQEKQMAKGKTTIYVCVNKTCKLPVHTVEDAITQLIN